MTVPNNCMGVFRFTNDYKNLFDSVIYPVVSTHTGLVTHDARSYYEAHTVKMDLIERMIRDSRLIIVDISEENGNVFFEFGIGFAHAKPKIILCSKSSWEGHWKEKMPFDISGRDLLIYDDAKDLRLKLGRHIVDALYNSSRQTVSWHSATATNYVRSNTELEIHDRGKIWSDTGILRPFTLSYEGIITEVTKRVSGEVRGPFADIRVFFSARPDLFGTDEPDSYPRIVIIFPWEYAELEAFKYECHVDYWPNPAVQSAIRLQQASVAEQVKPGDINSSTPYRFKFFVSFVGPNLVVESDLFLDNRPRVEVPISNFGNRNYPLHLAQHIGFEAINCHATITDITIKQIYS